MLEEGVTVKVLFVLDAVGDDDICTQVLKLSEDTWKVPEHVVLEVFVVTEVVSIASEKVIEMLSPIETKLLLSVGHA